MRSPKVFLFDEPLSSLDAKMRVQMRSEISKLHAELRNTMIYVTHDQVEAMTMGDRICVLRDGMVMQVADPLTVYRDPANLFVAGFIGSPPMNLLKGRVEKREGYLFVAEPGGKGAMTIPLKGRLEKLANRYLDKEIVFGIRPEHVTSESRNGNSLPVSLIVEIAEPMGSESLVYLKTAAGNVIARTFSEHCCPK